MITTTHNALKIKIKLSPDYRRDTTCRVRNLKTSMDITLPTEVVKMLRNGKVRFK